MTTPHLALYRLLIKFGATEAEAEVAAHIDTATLATKQDLLELELRLAWKIGTLVIGAMVGLTGIFAIIVGWLTQR